MAAVTAAFAMALGWPGAVQAAPDPEPQRPSADASPHLPDGWRITGSGGTEKLEWRSPDRVPMGGARIEFRSGDRLLGHPAAAADGRTFRLPLDGVRLGQARDLRVEAAGRRLDAEGTNAGRGRDLEGPSAPSPLTGTLPVNPVNKVDPGVAGKFRTVRGEYSLPSVRLPGLDERVEMKAVVVAPAGATGRRPLVLFLHGRHDTCFDTAGTRTSDWPCGTGQKQVPSYRGHLHDQKLLASQGYVTVSVSANGINAQDAMRADGGAPFRSSLIRLHLGHWADWAADPAKAPAVVRKAPRADLGRVLLVGHSRGGEAVNQATLDSLYPPPAAQDGYRGRVRWTIRGTVLTAPSALAQNPVPDVPSMTILPGCDGDMPDLQGEAYVDGTRGVSRGTALHSAVYMVGANHNYFNTEWTPGQAAAPAEDDFTYSGDQHDRVCSEGTKTRLTAKQQQKAGSTYIATAARLFIARDDRARPLIDGSGVRAASAGSARIYTHAVGAGRSGAFLPDASATVGGGRLCAQLDPDPAVSCLPSRLQQVSPHFALWETAKEPGRYALAMRWTKSGATTRFSPAHPVSLSGAKMLTLRVIVPPNTTGTRLDVSLTDASGKRATLGRVRVDGLPGTGRTSSYWAREVRVPLSAAARAGLDLARVKTLYLTPRTSSGKAWLMDAWGWRPGTPAVEPAQLARVDVGRMTVKEGGPGTRTYQVPVTVSGKGSGQIRVFVDEPGHKYPVVHTVTVHPGASVNVRMTVKGDDRYEDEVHRRVFVKSIHGAVVGSHRGKIIVKNDDPEPTMRVTPVADRVTEGRQLVWRISLSAVADESMSGDLWIRPIRRGAELSTKDVSPSWLKENFEVSPGPQRALSRLPDEPRLSFDIPAGSRSVLVKVPTIADRVTEPVESLLLMLNTAAADDEEIKGPKVTGTVRDAA
ncbi:hypothetical protein [Streptomyces tailanensis]|uniref:hypothetical protein n=1 Tax=Streptomyces tailanensis TaxID=2569858 RepID=UPI003CCC6888